MIVVIGKALIREEHLPQARLISDLHVRRSRAEPGCLEHGYSIGSEQTNLLVFVERWLTLEDLRAHVALPESRAFGQALAGFSDSRPSMEVYACTAVDWRG